MTQYSNSQVQITIEFIGGNLVLWVDRSGGYQMHKTSAADVQGDVKRITGLMEREGYTVSVVDKR